MTSEQHTKCGPACPAPNQVFHTPRDARQAATGETHIGPREDCPDCSTGNPLEICFAVARKTGTLVSRDGRLCWATRQEWDGLPSLVAQVIPVTGNLAPLGSVPLMDAGKPPDVVGRLVDLVSSLEDTVVRLSSNATELGTQAQIVANRPMRERELLTRAAEMIDPDTGALGSVTHEMRLDWLAQYREVTL